MQRPRAKRIVMVSTHGYVQAEPVLGKPDTGGQVVYVLELSKCLARMGYQVDILTRRLEDLPEEEPVAENVRILRFACGGDGFIPKETLCDHIPEWIENASRWLEGVRDEVVFINSHYWDAGLAGRGLAKGFQLPHVHTPHSLGAWKRDSMPGTEQEKEARYNFARRVRDEKEIYHDCALNVATTSQQHELLIAEEYAVPAERIVEIPPGYDDTRFFPVSPSTRYLLKGDLGLHGRIVLALGRIARNKGYDLLIRAMPPVLERFADASLVLAIGAPDPSPDEARMLYDLRELAHALGIADRVVFHDFIPGEQLADYYRAADVFALSSRYEPFGMTAIESMACGTPTVITTEGGLWHYVNWGVEAIYANPNDPEAFGHSLCDVLAFPQVAESLAENGARKARAQFTWTAVTQKFLNDVLAAITPRRSIERAPHKLEGRRSAKAAPTSA
jgi:mannosylfructose-phosphate synthase